MSDCVGAVNVSVVRNLSFDTSLRDDMIADLIRFALVQEYANGDWEVAVAFVDVDEMSQLHARFLGLSEPTDILTFPFGEPGGDGGDIAICLPVAAEQGIEHGNELDDELAFLILHGVLHLIGYDDDTDARRAVMLERQQEILDAWSGIRT